ncbi:MAG: hypothetical protein H6995_00720 [Pseudomonadales bacterium]|nr:hypothetical protein [Pseudomonadales bacterium]MCP5213519.1 hypothetical protein [Pseudomonadales bacterium]
MKQNFHNLLRVPLLVLGMASLVVGTLAGIARLGWSVPPVGLSQIPHHGVLMVAAFFGTVIGLERAVAIAKGWAYSAPLLSGLGGISLMLGFDPQLGFGLILLGSVIFVAASVAVLKIQPAIHNWILLSGAIGLVVGNLLLLLGVHMQISVLWWMVYLVLTIAGERLELSRLAIRSDRKRQGLAVLSLLPWLGALIGIWRFSLGELIVAVGILAIALWLISYDIARRTVRQSGLPRFTAFCMLAGYGWLFVAALLLLLNNLSVMVVVRDTPLHALFLGFVFSMVLGHALIIFPAVTRLKIPYSPLFYIPLVFLHGTLLVRVTGGLSLQTKLYALGGLLNAVALVVFIAAMIYAIYRGARSRRS